MFRRFRYWWSLPITYYWQKPQSRLELDFLGFERITNYYFVSLLGKYKIRGSSINHSHELIILRQKVKKLQDAKDSVFQRLKKALKLSENATFQKAIKKFTAAAVIFTMLQFRETRKKNLGRRFTKEEKVTALTLCKQGPRAYRWMNKFFVLPSPLTLKTMKFVRNNSETCVPLIKNWIVTLDNMEYEMKTLFNKHNLTSVWMRHFNQDTLENFFGCIWSRGYRNNSPSCAQFEVAFAALLINNMSSLHSPGANWEANSCKGFKSLNQLFFNNTIEQKPSYSSSSWFWRFKYRNYNWLSSKAK